MKETIKIIQSQEKTEIQEAFEQVLYVPDINLRRRIINKITEYICSNQNEENYKMKFFITKQDENHTGIALCINHPTYSSYGRKVGAVGWINVKDIDSCKIMIKNCETFLKSMNLKKIRLSVNFPKGLGGLGFQTMGFNQQMMYGVAFNDPNSKTIDFLKTLGYKKESEYVCLDIAYTSWESRKISDKSIIFRYFTLNEIKEKIDDFHDLVKRSFHNFAPDSSGSYRLNEIIDTLSLVPESFYKIKKDFTSKEYSKIIEYQEAWDTCNMEKIIPWFHLAFDKTSNKLIGIIMCLPDLYQVWLNHPITRSNVDTVMIDEHYRGKGIFSSLSNLGQLTLKLYGINYFEGTSIWSNNEYALKSIFPHGKPIRKHIILQKSV